MFTNLCFFLTYILNVLVGKNAPFERIFQELCSIHMSLRITGNVWVPIASHSNA